MRRAVALFTVGWTLARRPATPVVKKSTFCAKFAVTKPAASTMESHRVTDAEDSSNDPSEDWPLCKYSPHHLLTHFFKDNLNISPNFEYHFFLKGTWTTSAKKMVIVW